MPEEELIEIFDENNIFLKRTKRSLAHNKGLFHHSVNIVLFNSKGELFLQQRSKDKDVCPLAWDLSAAEHLKIGENYLQAARRCLKEELNIAIDLIKIRNVHLQKNVYLGGKIKDYEFVELYKGVYDGKIRLDPKEVEEGSFFKIKTIENEITKKKFTPWFLDEWKYLKNSGFLS